MTSELPTPVDPMGGDTFHYSAAQRYSTTGITAEGNTVIERLSGPSQQQTPTMAIYEPKQLPTQSSDRNLPLPPGMEIQLGTQKYTVRYLAYEMSHEKASAYVERYTGSPFTRMSSPPEPKRLRRDVSDNDGTAKPEWERVETPTTALPTPNPEPHIERFQDRSGSPPIPEEPTVVITSPAPSPPLEPADRPAGEDSEQIIRSSPPGAQAQQMPMGAPAPVGGYSPNRPHNPMYSLAAVATGVAPLVAQAPVANTTAPIPLGATELRPPNYMNILPPPPEPSPTPSGKSKQRLGYFWEDGVWKVWEASDSGEDTTEGADRIQMAPSPSNAPRAEYPLPAQPSTQTYPSVQLQYQQSIPPAGGVHYSYPQQQQQQQQYQTQFYYAPQQPQVAIATVPATAAVAAANLPSAPTASLLPAQQQVHQYQQHPQQYWYGSHQVPGQVVAPPAYAGAILPQVVIGRAPSVATARFPT